MKNILFLLLLTSLFSCSGDLDIMNEDLIGTWILSSVSGTCASLPVTGSADQQGCIRNPALEVNCSLIEFHDEGQLSYAYSLIKGEGTYTIESDGITICTDRCLFYTFMDNSLELQTGTIPSCDPVYIFKKTTSSLDQIVEENTLKRIKNVRRNGLLHQSYIYDSQGLLQQIQRYTSDGNLSRTEVFTYTPLTTTRTITDPSTGEATVSNTFYEAPDRLRVDYLDASDQLAYYWLYFYEPSYTCSYSRAERYIGETLNTLRNSTYSGSVCNSVRTDFVDGNSARTVSITRDDRQAYSRALRNPLIPERAIGNIISYTSILSDGSTQSNSYTASFTYDEQDYPLTSIRTYVGGDNEVYTYEYE